MLNAPPKKQSAIYAYGATHEGDLLGFRVAPNGELQRLPQGAIRTAKTPFLAIHPDRKDLYVVQQFIPSEEGINSQEYPPRKTRASSLLFRYHIKRDGTLLLAERLTLPYPAGDIIIPPRSPFLYIEKPNGWLQVYRRGREGQLNSVGDTEGGFTFSLYSGAGVRDESRYAFTPNGEYVLAFSGTGFVDHSENYLRRFRILPDGRWKHELPEYHFANGEAQEGRWEGDTGPVVLTPDGMRAFITGMTGRVFCYSVSGKGELKPLLQVHLPLRTPVSKGMSQGQMSVRGVDPKGRFLYVLEPDRAEPPAQRIGVYAIGRGRAITRISQLNINAPFESLIPEPMGRFLYELAAEWNEAGKPIRTWLTVHRISKDGTGSVAIPRRRFMEANLTKLHFVLAVQ
jgi:hypothetical protein